MIDVTDSFGSTLLYSTGLSSSISNDLSLAQRKSCKAKVFAGNFQFHFHPIFQPEGKLQKNLRASSTPLRHSTQFILLTFFSFSCSLLLLSSSPMSHNRLWNQNAQQLLLLLLLLQLQLLQVFVLFFVLFFL